MTNAIDKHLEDLEREAWDDFTAWCDEWRRAHPDGEWDDYELIWIYNGEEVYSAGEVE